MASDSDFEVLRKSDLIFCNRLVSRLHMEDRNCFSTLQLRLKSMSRKSSKDVAVLLQPEPDSVMWLDMHRKCEFVSGEKVFSFLFVCLSLLSPSCSYIQYLL